MTQSPRADKAAYIKLSHANLQRLVKKAYDLGFDAGFSNNKMPDQKSDFEKLAKMLNRMIGKKRTK